MHYEHNLVSSLKGCDLLVEDWDRQSCYGGAFMENVVDATEPHHGMPGMDMPEENRAFKQIDKNDYNYPCTILPERYLTTCYQNQVSIIMYFDDHQNAAGREGLHEGAARRIATCASRASARTSTRSSSAIT